MNSIISHRGIFDSQETSLDSIQKCIDNEIGLEIEKDNFIHFSNLPFCIYSNEHLRIIEHDCWVIL